MKKFSKKGALLFASVTMLAAFALPASGASAARWYNNGSPLVGSLAVHAATQGTSTLNLTVTALGVSTSCRADFTGSVTAPSSGAITAVNFLPVAATPCTTTASGCAVSAVKTAGSPNFTLSVASLTSVTIGSVSVDVTLSGAGCSSPGTIRVTGSITGAHTNGTGSAAVAFASCSASTTVSKVTFSNTSGLTAVLLPSTPLGGVTITGVLNVCAGAGNVLTIGA